MNGNKKAGEPSSIPDSNLKHSISGHGIRRHIVSFRDLCDLAFSPLWARLTQARQRAFFQWLVICLGDTRLFGEIGASYIRFLQRKAVK
ncbi:hypothetical protein [Vampirovibrio sp.]|uniref:hypothetical protein n=1 Tax=Vampirovibrio sp. TaxID=2717857 RepID=UPI0035940649